LVATSAVTTSLMDSWELLLGEEGAKFIGDAKESEDGDQIASDIFGDSQAHIAGDMAKLEGAQNYEDIDELAEEEELSDDEKSDGYEAPDEKPELEDDDLMPQTVILERSSDGKDAILRFTELFAPRRHIPPSMLPFIKKSKKLRKKRKRVRFGDKDEQPSIEPLQEIDDEESKILDIQVTIPSKRQQELQIKRFIELKHAEMRKAQELIDEDTQKQLTQYETDQELLKRRMAEMNMARRTTYYLVDQVPWEDEIVWDLKTPNAPTTENAPTSAPTIGSSSMPITSTSKWGEIDGTDKDLLLVQQELQEEEAYRARMEAEKKRLEELAAVEAAAAATAATQPVPVAPTVTENDPNDEDDPNAGPADATPAPSEPAANGKKPRKKYTRHKKRMQIQEEERKLVAETTDKSIARRYREETELDEVERPLDRVINSNLLACDWLDSVTWDDAVGPKVATNTQLILDMNDTRIMLVNPTEQVQEEKPKPPPPPPQETQVPPTEAGGEATTAAERPPQLFVKSDNPYNLSIDHEYEMITNKDENKGHKARRIVRHSLPALRLDEKYFSTTINMEDDIQFHRTEHEFPRNKTIPIVWRKPRKERKKQKEHYNVIKKTELSAHDHRMVLMEYVEERPPILNQVGMATMIENYYKKAEEDHGKIPKVDDGITDLVESQEEVPLFGPLKDGEFLTSSTNNMFSAQIFKHKPAYTDFLLTTRKTTDGEKFYIREIPMCYTVGHTQPNVEVWAPNSRSANNYIKNRLTLFILRKFLERKNRNKKMRVRMEEIRQAFPDIPDGTIRKELRELATFQRDVGDGCWIFKGDTLPTEEILQNLVTSEMVCLNESMAEGQNRLDKAGVTQLATMVAFYLSFSQLEGKGPIRDAIRFIERETMNTPWNKTTNFNNAREGKEGAKLQILGVVNQNLSAEEIERLAKETEAAVQTETDAMHPSMSDHEMKQILLRAGYIEEQIKGMNRSERKQAARRHKDTSSIVNVSNKKNAKEIARNVKFREVLQEIFSQEASKLAQGLEYYDNDTKQTAALDRAAATSKTAMEINEDLLREDEEDEEDGDMDEDKITDERSQSRPANEEDDVMGMFGNGGIFSSTNGNEMDSGSESDTASVTSDTTGKKDKGKQPEAGPGKTDQYTPAKGKRIFVKKTVYRKNENGERIAHTEEIRDPIAVDYYIKQKERLDASRGKKKKKKKHNIGGENGFVWSANEHRKLQDMLRRWKKSRDANIDENASKRKRSDLTTGKYEVKKSGQKKEKPKRKPAPRKRPPPKPKVENTEARSSSSHANGNGTTSSSSSSKKRKRKEEMKEEDEEGASLKITIPIAANKKPAKRKTSSTTLPALDDDGTDYLSPRPQTKRRRTTNIDQLASVFRQVFDVIMMDPASHAFHQPVDTRAYQDYRRVVQNPIDLSMVAKKIKNLEYVDQHSFLNDIILMRKNAEAYCTLRFPYIVENAKIVERIGISEMAKRESEISQILEGSTPASSTPVNL
jgi:transcription initiation factor TFIID subunit 1